MRPPKLPFDSFRRKTSFPQINQLSLVPHWSVLSRVSIKELVRSYKAATVTIWTDRGKNSLVDPRLEKNRRPPVDRVRFLTATSSWANSVWAGMGLMIIQLSASPLKRSETGDWIRLPGWPTGTASKTIGHSKKRKNVIVRPSDGDSCSRREQSLDRLAVGEATGDISRKSWE
jgi:hypothetical protein